MSPYPRFAAPTGRCLALGIAALWSLLAAPLLGSRAAASVLTTQCSAGPTPAASLLFPYFEVDFTDPSGTTTLTAVSNDSAGTVVARVVLWSDLGIPVLSFDIFLGVRMTQSMNLRDLLNGNLPSAGSHGALTGFPGCTANPPYGPGRTLPAATRNRVRALLTGNPAPGTNLCASFGRGDDVARGYVTVDVVDECNPISTNRAFTPASIAVLPPYFAPGGASTGIARPWNLITGDWMFVVPDQAFASGAKAVHLVADPVRFPVSSGNLTFYGPYVGFSSRDARMPLPGTWRTRYLQGGAFSGGTDLIVWHQQRFGNETEAFDCTLDPYHFPVGYTSLVARREDGTGATSLGAVGPVPFPIGLVTQRVPVSSFAPLPAPFGVIDLDLDLPDIPIADGRPGQAWVAPIFKASGLFSVGMNAHPLGTGCIVLP